MNKEIAQLVADLCKFSNADAPAMRTEIDLQTSCHNFDWVGDLGIELAAQAVAGKDSQGRCEAVLDYVLHALAARPGAGSLSALLRVPASAHADGTGRDKAERRLASFVARNHRIEDIARLVFTEELQSVHSREFSACLVHELVLTSEGVERYPELRSFAERLVALGHPLAVLPLALLPEEQGLRRPPGVADDWTWTVPPTSMASFDKPEWHSTPSMERRMADTEMTEVSVSADIMGAAVQHWCSQSNGKVAAQEFWTPDPVMEDDFPAAFKLLPLIPWPANKIPGRLYPAEPDLVLRILLTAAVRGPAYGSGLYGAYGRVATWRSLAGLTGAPANAPITRTAELVRQSRWFRVDIASQWFYKVAWDLAIAVLRPGGQEIAVLAASDTD